MKFFVLLCVLIASVKCVRGDPKPSDVSCSADEECARAGVKFCGCDARVQRCTQCWECSAPDADLQCQLNYNTPEPGCRCVGGVCVHCPKFD